MTVADQPFNVRRRCHDVSGCGHFLEPWRTLLAVTSAETWIHTHTHTHTSDLWRRAFTFLTIPTPENESRKTFHWRGDVFWWWTLPRTLMLETISLFSYLRPLNLSGWPLKKGLLVNVQIRLFRRTEKWGMKKMTIFFSWDGSGPWMNETIHR